MRERKRRRRSKGSEPLTQDLRLSVEGYKAVRTRQELRIAPLTIIAGVNSSGKSSFMQPFLMMKQTLESTFDPGPLLLYGPNIKVTEYQQMFSRGKAKYDAVDRFTVEILSGSRQRSITFGTTTGELAIKRDALRMDDEIIELGDPLSPDQRKKLRAKAEAQANSMVELVARNESADHITWEPAVTRNRCFLESHLVVSTGKTRYRFEYFIESEDDQDWVDLIRGIIHVPGLRGNPERAYPRSAVGDTYPGSFDTYVANIIYEWGTRRPALLSALAVDLESLGLTWKVTARRVNDASVELMVGRMPHAQQGGANDLVSVADVGFGVSQTLPVLVALHAASPGQIVYIEQPEIHLHPRAQLALAESLVAAAARGVVVIAETHSSLLIRGIQTCVAQGDISADDLSLNWFGRRESDGSQFISVAELDEEGRFGDWPIDFDDIAQQADWAYLDAIRGSR